MWGAILLAAGKSTRMGQLKALLPWGNTTLIEYQVQQMSRSVIQQLVVVLGYEHQRLEPVIRKLQTQYRDQLNIIIQINPDYDEGKTASIRAGLAGLTRPVKALAIIGVDQPVLAKTIDSLLLGVGDKGPEIRIPVYQGKRGHPPVFTDRFFPELREVNEQTEGLRQIMKSNQEYIQLMEVREPQVLLNLNREEDYRKALGMGLDREDTER